MATRTETLAVVRTGFVHRGSTIFAEAAIDLACVADKVFAIGTLGQLLAFTRIRNLDLRACGLAGIVIGLAI